MRVEERSLQLLLWAAAERRRATAAERHKKAHPAGSAVSASEGGLPLSTGCDFNLTSARLGHEATVTVTGELDCATAPRLADELMDLLADRECRITVDLEGTTFIDSTGLATLVRAVMAARHGGGDIVLQAPGRSVRKLLEISGADRLFVMA